jgi:hypothetical protein
MSQGTFEFNGGHLFELTRLNRVLSQLNRPALCDEWLTPMTKAELGDLGVFAAGHLPQRKELIERLWSRKRQLLRQAAADDGWGPEFPVA